MKMSKIAIVIDAFKSDRGQMKSSPATQHMTAAMQQAIAAYSPASMVAEMEVVPAAELLSGSEDTDTIYCPLTIDLPASIDFPAKEVFSACKNVAHLREWVEQTLEIPAGNRRNSDWFGDYWLPIILTAKGPMYAEAIGEGSLPNSYCQPVDIDDRHRQPLYQLAYRLLEAIAARPAVYLLQFGWYEGRPIFDRLWPFPAAPATASVGVQDPNLFACHWHCLTNQPLYEVSILPSNTYRGTDYFG